MHACGRCCQSCSRDIGGTGGFITGTDALAHKAVHAPQLSVHTFQQISKACGAGGHMRSDSCASPGWLAAAPGQTRATIWKMQPDGVLCRATTRELGLEALAGILACTYAFDAIHSK